MAFKIREDFIIKALDRPNRDDRRLSKTLTTFNTDQLSQAISYFLNLINKVDASEKPIGIHYGSLSFLTIAFALAIIKSKKETGLIIDDKVIRAGDDLKLFSHVFVTGPNWRTPDSILSVVDKEPNHRSYVDSVSIMDEVEAWPGREELIFEYSKDVKTYIVNFNSAKLDLLSTSGLMEESSIIAAMNNYVYDDDHCALYRRLNHVGVGTLIIYPALFKAKSVALVDHINQWDIACEGATHVHMSYQMIQENFKLPKKLRTLSTGGYHFSRDCMDYVYSLSDIDRIVDCYGTGYCPPPLAIRELTKENISSLQPFKWVNSIVRPESVLLEKGPGLLITSDQPLFDKMSSSGHDGKSIGTGDIIERVNDDTFYLYGNSLTYIRVLESRISSIELQKMLDAVIPDVTIEFTIKEGTRFPKLITQNYNKEKLDKFVIDNKIEADIEYI